MCRNTTSYQEQVEDAEEQQIYKSYSRSLEARRGQIQFNVTPWKAPNKSRHCRRSKRAQSMKKKKKEKACAFMTEM
jgi:hypothetical protein